jgi:hypothetical protein
MSAVGGSLHPERDPFATTRAAASAFNPLALAALCGGVQLVAPNIHRLWRLQALAAMSLGAPDQPSTRDPTIGDLRELVNAGALGARANQQEDPFDDVIAEEIAFHHGSFLVSTGLAEDGVASLRSLVRVTLLSPLLPDDRRNELTRTTAAVLRLSDHVLRSSNLHRNMAAPDRPSNGATIPGASTAQRFAATVSFDDERLREVAATIDLAALEPFIAPTAVVRFSTEEITEGHTSRWPLRRYEDTLVLAEPFSLTLALRDHLMFSALAEVGPEALAEVFGRAVDEDVRDALHHLGGRASDPIMTTRTAERPWTEISLLIDDALELRCLVVGDGFTGVRAEDPYVMWDQNETLSAAQDHLESEAGGSDDEILGLVIAAPAGGTAIMGTQESKHANLRLQVMSLSDVATICFLESGDSLALWKWERAKDAITGRVLSWSALDLYSVYRGHERSFGHLAGATFVTVEPASGSDMRTDYKKIRDLHGARFVDGTVREVRRTEPSEKRSPIYHPVELGDRVRLYVAGLPLDIWVVGPSHSPIETWSHVNTVAYWLSQLGEPLGEIFAQLASCLSCAAIELRLTNPPVWTGAEPDPGGGETATQEIVGDTVLLSLGLPIARALSSPTNEADRMIVAEIAKCLDGLARAHGMPGVSNTNIDAAVNSVAPLGPKKHLIGMPHEGNELAEEADGPPRLVQQADVSRARELLAEHLTEFGWHDATVPHDRRDEVLKDAVGFLFQELCSRLDETAPDGLLDGIVLENERLAAASERRAALLPARLATYPESAEHVREDVAKEAQASIACRFLIEYVAARPPTGTVRWSLRRHDECMALLAELLDWAYLDDAVNAGLSATDLLIRDDGQLRLRELGRYERGQSSFFDTVVGGLKDASASIFARRFEGREGQETREPNATLIRLDGPMIAEAGLAVDGFVNLLHAASRLVRQADAQLVTMAKREAIAQLAETCGEAPGLVERAVDYMTLGPRNKFLEPPSGATRDVLPSRSARRWSYVRRPFIKVDTPDGPTLTWGRRHPLASLRVLIGQLLSGRYQHLAEGPELRAALGAVGSEAGHEFEERTDGLIKAAGMKAIVACTSIGGDSLHHTEQGDLGDIDVLACDPGRRTIWVVECKDLAGAITTSDFVDEMTEHFGAGDATTVDRLSARVNWVAKRKAAALTAFGQDDSGKRWKSLGVFVTGVPVIAPYITDVPFPIVPIDELAGWLSRRETASRSKASVKRRRRRR